MARKTKKQKLRASVRVEKATITPRTTQNVVAVDSIEAQVASRGILKTIVIIGILFILQGAVFIAKSKGMF
ncbi:MAG: hypothetical protein UZ22_OP11002000983 [Microgenomates bacterium OLB23]|nr:MAG: hypothetical protein UZ22_OP11002000983 [Microgenomates bacterium OLB23]